MNKHLAYTPSKSVHIEESGMVKGLDIPKDKSKITKPWLQRLLAGSLNGKFIIDVQFTEKLDNGDNFFSNIHFIQAKDTSGVIYKLVVKLMPEGNIHKSLVQDMRAFQKECEFYNLVLSDIKKSFPGTLSNSIPRCYYAACDFTNAVIALQDVSSFGYRMPDKFKGLSLIQTETVVEELATLHAAGFGLKEKYDLEDRYPNLMHNHFSDAFNDQLKKSGVHCLQMMKEYGMSSSILDRLSSYIGHSGANLPPKRRRLTMSIRYMATICHGDTWCNNFLFHAANGGGISLPDSVMMVDFQLLRYTHPAIDLSYLLFTSTTRELRKNLLLSRILPYYHQCLLSNLKKMGVSLGFEYPLKRFVEEYQMLCEYGFLVAMLMLPRVLKASEYAKKPDHIDNYDVDIKKNSSWSSTLIQERLAGAVEDMLELNIL